MISNQCKQDSILCYETLYVIQGGQESGVVWSGKVRKEKGLFKVREVKEVKECHRI